MANGSTRHTGRKFGSEMSILDNAAAVAVHIHSASNFGLTAFAVASRARLKLYFWRYVAHAFTRVSSFARAS